MSDTNASNDHTDFHRLWWHSRRGMLELDVLLLPFLEWVLLAQPQSQSLSVQWYVLAILTRTGQHVSEEFVSHTENPWVHPPR